MQNEIIINEVTSQDYHRNGICGEGFYALDFIWSDRDYKNVKARAIIFPNDEDETKEPTHYAITTDNLSDHWRGDHFISLLWSIIETERKARWKKLYGIEI